MSFPIFIFNHEQGKATAFNVLRTLVVRSWLGLLRILESVLLSICPVDTHLLSSQVTGEYDFSIESACDGIPVSFFIVPSITDHSSHHQNSRGTILLRFDQHYGV